MEIGKLRVRAALLATGDWKLVTGDQQLETCN